MYVVRDNATISDEITKADGLLFILEEAKKKEITPKPSKRLSKNWFNVGLNPMDDIIIEKANPTIPKSMVTRNRHTVAVRREGYLNKSKGFVPSFTSSISISLHKNSCTSTSLMRSSLPKFIFPIRFRDSQITFAFFVFISDWGVSSKNMMMSMERIR